ncbi:hypothetical protein EB796_015508 [Bugula neritina]|uniref:Uncharacterized protein n=1 Tax=Bugula neritina TaxID=10212 RepID=A0A7J7JK53_BUGNE|nr:hypothetical protein EB796_015508 [Bugula neritina]
MLFSHQRLMPGRSGACGDSELNSNQGDKVWQIVPSNLNITANSVVIVGDPNQHITNVGASTSQTQFTLVNTTQAKATLADAPHWATLIQDCEKVGHYYGAGCAQSRNWMLY